MTNFCLRSLQVALLLFVATNSVTAFVLAPSTRSSPLLITTTVAGKQLQRPSAVQPLQMEFKPIAFLNDKMRFAGPVTTLGLTLPQLQDLSIKNIQRVGETSLAAMLVIAAIQGALVSEVSSMSALVFFQYSIFLQYGTHMCRSCISMPPTQLVNLLCLEVEQVGRRMHHELHRRIRKNVSKSTTTSDNKC